jgi:hypothetical protein
LFYGVILPLFTLLLVWCFDDKCNSFPRVLISKVLLGITFCVHPQGQGGISELYWHRELITFQPFQMDKVSSRERTRLHRGHLESGEDENPSVSLSPSPCLLSVYLPIHPSTHTLCCAVLEMEPKVFAKQSLSP